MQNETYPLFEFRCTRRQPYEPGCPGYDNPHARQGYYFQARTEEEARSKMNEMFPGEEIDVELWKQKPLMWICCGVEHPMQETTCRSCGKHIDQVI